MNRILKILCGVACAFVFCFLAIGYAAVQDELIVNGSVSVEQYYLKYDFSSTDTDGYTLADDGTLKIEEIYYDELAKKNYRVVTIADNGFSDYTNKAGVTALDLPDSLIGIGENAFSDFTMLSYVEFGAGFTEFKDTSFSGCTYLTEDAMYVPSDSLVVRNQLGADITAFELNGQNYTIELVSTYDDERGVVTSYQGEEKQIYAYATVSQSKFELAENGEIVNLLLPPTKYTYATLDADNGLHIKNRYGFLIENDTKLVEADGTYDIATEVYALPSKNGVCIATLDNSTVPTGARTDGWDAVRNNNAFEQTITSVAFADPIKLQGDLSDLFYHFTALETANLENADFSGVTSLYEFFDSCQKLKTIVFADSINTSNVKSMGKMFYWCMALISVDVSGFDTENVESMMAMFWYCESLTSLDVSHFNTSNVTRMDDMFHNCASLTTLDVSSFDTSKVTTMNEMFKYLKKMTVLDLSNFVVTVNTDTAAMFDEDKLLEKIYVSENFVVNPNSGSRMFYNCVALMGGKGTKFDKSHTNGEYGRIDGENGLRGYFTLKTGEVTPATLNWNVSAVAQGYEIVSPVDWIFVGEKVSIKLNNLVDANIRQVALSGNGHSASAAVGTDGVVVIPGDFIADGATITITTSRTITVTSELQNITATVTSGYASEDANVSVKLIPDAGYGLPTEATVKIGESEETPYSITDGVVTIPIGDDWAENTTVIVKAAGVQQVHLDATLTGVTATYNTPVPVPGKDFVITFKAVEGYNLPTTVKVKIGDTETDYKVQNSRITIEAAKVVAGNSIAVTANGTQKIAVNMTSFDEGLSVTYNPTVPVSGKDFTVTLTGETLPDGVTVTIDGVEVATAVYDKDAGTIIIPGDLLTAATTSITLEAVESTPAVCTCETKCTELTETCEVCKTDITNCLGTEPTQPVESSEPYTIPVNYLLTDLSYTATNSVASPDEDYCVVFGYADSFVLPEFITVTIDEAEYLVYTDGLEHREGDNLPPMPVFEPTEAKLTIPAELLTAETKSIEIKATAVPVPEPETNDGEETTLISDDLTDTEETEADGEQETAGGEETTVPTDATEPAILPSEDEEDGEETEQPQDTETDPQGQE